MFVNFFHLQGVIESVEFTKNVSWDRYHPNTRGNECAGRKMAEYLSVNGF